ncbi:hypothetical protein DN752_17625 [Echinicola strongylocentroti]|uniref:Uncharacterized protein n=1 Tax=Echinicola strongylocentroti TaxID=1795355 RepID=A0A2Z4IL22_9BACT|nr:hypothetical protein [Echinicola strongylocentroti]AWW31802.1 hypothetical protein DN752_17625 [Echinicola strongylocentroti]
MEVKTIVDALREKGRVCVMESGGKPVEMIVPEFYNENDDPAALFVLVDLFQVRGVAGQFSEIALDIIEFATKPTIYTSWASDLLENGPVHEGKVKFSILKKGSWNKIVFSFSKPLIFQEGKVQDAMGTIDEKFPLFHPGVKKLFLSADGEVKIGE